MKMIRKQSLINGNKSHKKKKNKDEKIKNIATKFFQKHMKIIKNEESNI